MTTGHPHAARTLAAMNLTKTSGAWGIWTGGLGNLRLELTDRHIDDADRLVDLLPIGSLPKAAGLDILVRYSIIPLRTDLLASSP